MKIHYTMDDETKVVEAQPLPLQAFDSAGTLMAKIIRECQVEDPSFTVDHPITVFGDEKKPLFCISDIEKVLGKKNIRGTVRADSKRKVQMYNPGDDFDKVLVNYDGTTKKMLCFTRRGLYKYIMTSRGAVSNMFRNFLLIVLEKLMSNQVVTLEESVQEFTLQIEDERRKALTAQAELSLTMSKYGDAYRAKNVAEIGLQRLRMRHKQEQDRSEMLEASLLGDLDDVASNEKIELDIMREVFMKKAHVCIENPGVMQNRMTTRIKKKKREVKAVIDDLGFDLNSGSESDSVVGDDGFEFYDDGLDEMFSMRNPPPNQEELYYSIVGARPGKTKTPVIQIYYENKEHLADLKVYMKANFRTPEPGVYCTTLSDIRSKLSELFIRRHSGLRVTTRS